MSKKITGGRPLPSDLLKDSHAEHNKKSIAKGTSRGDRSDDESAATGTNVSTKQHPTTSQLCSNPGCPEQSSSRCGRCGGACYCCKEHQVAHWKTHKLVCKASTASTATPLPSTRAHFAAYPKASQHGTVRMTRESAAQGLCTDGMSACIALIFTSLSSGRASLSHTPLKPSAAACVAEAQWVGEGAGGGGDTECTVVLGTLYESKQSREQFQLPMVLDHIQTCLRGYARVNKPRVATKSCAAVVCIDKKFRVLVPVLVDPGPFHRIGYQPQGHAPSPGKGPGHLHYESLILNGTLENCVDEGLGLRVEFDGSEWVQACLSAKCEQMLAVVGDPKRGPNALVRWLQSECVWSREDGMNGRTCDPVELRMFAPTLEGQAKSVIALRRK
ncbi:hypothetical protein B484DRAFT_481317 [Ochromonadaceae sp. CCMP2298]|nr:hypothetical protein B484DRAFT_481317 [Ochromonadaceae sp. CCMP2298]